MTTQNTALQAFAFQTISERLKQERMRLHLSDVEFGEHCARKKNDVENWESGIASPEAVTLKLMDEIGVDVCYVITGRRNITPNIALQVSIGNRLKEERERLNLSLQSLGDMGELDADTQQAFEAGKLDIELGYWRAVSQLGVDVAYVLAGVRTANVATTSPQVALLYNYRKQSADIQSALGLLAARLENNHE